MEGTVGEFVREIVMTLPAGIRDVGRINGRPGIILREDTVDSVTGGAIGGSGITQFDSDPVEGVFKCGDAVCFQAEFADDHLGGVAIGAGFGHISSEDTGFRIRDFADVVAAMTIDTTRCFFDTVCHGDTVYRFGILCLDVWMAFATIDLAHSFVRLIGLNIVAILA